MKYFTYLVFRVISWVFSLMPFRLLYFFSDMLSFFMQKVIRYRRTLVYNNIQSAFPDYPPEQHLEILKASYKNLSDIILEGIKGSSMGFETIKKRHRTVNPELLDDAFANGKSVILVTGHYNNWEWGALSAPLFVHHRVIGLYKKINNPYINQYFIHTRSKTGIILVEIKETGLSFQKYSNALPPSLFLMAADQSPSNIKDAFWVHFLNRPTACLHGLEKYAKSYDLPIIYCDIIRRKRGFYEMELSWLVTLPSTYKEGEITGAFMAKLEENIKLNPGNWLWSHNRWKHKYPE